MIRLAFYRVLAAAAVALAAAGAAAAQGSPEIDGFLRLSDKVCTGGQPTPAQLAQLAKEGIRTVVDLRDRSEHDVDAEAAAAAGLGLGFRSIPVRASEPKAAEADAFLESLSDASVYPVFIHCASGNRVGAFWMIRRVLVDGWTEEKAEEEARRIGLRSANLLDFAREYVRSHAGSR